MTQYDPNTQTWPTIATAAYGVANEMTSLWTGFAGTETGQYNSLLQLTRATTPGLMDMEYRYTAGANNGRIAQSKDWISGGKGRDGRDVNHNNDAETSRSSPGQ
jgi:hypothetical protein